MRTRGALALVVLLALVLGAGGQLSAVANPTTTTSTSSTTAPPTTTTSTPPGRSNFLVTGSTTIGTHAATDVPAGAGFSATVDPLSGVFVDGQFSIPVSSTVVSGVTVLINASDVGADHGTYDRATGALTIVATRQVVLSFGPGVAKCTIGPFTLTLSTETAGGTHLVGTPASGVVTAARFSVPAVAGTGAAGLCPDRLAAVLNGGAAPGFGLPTTGTAATYRLTATDQPVLPPPASPAAATPVPPPAAAPVAAGPRLTG